MKTINIGVAGITKLSNQYYILYEGHNRIDVFRDRSPYNFVSKLEIDSNDLCYLRDVCACPVSGNLFVTDSGNRCVWRIDASNDHAVSKWISVDGRPRTLAVISQIRLLVIVDSDKTRLAIYDVDGRLERYIDVPSDMQDVKHAVESSSGTFVVSHGQLDFRQHRVCEMSTDGKQVIRSFGDRCSHFAGSLNQPVYLAVHTDGQTIFVADSENERVVVLGKELSLQSFIKNEGYTSLCIYYDAEASDLVVGTKTKGISFIKYSA